MSIYLPSKYRVSVYNRERRHTNYLITRIDIKISENFTKILDSTGYAKAVYLMERVDLLKLRLRTIKSIDKYMNRDTWITTDDKGSGSHAGRSDSCHCWFV